jgi:hypothetical protein
LFSSPSLFGATSDDYADRYWNRPESWVRVSQGYENGCGRESGAPAPKRAKEEEPPKAEEEKRQEEAVPPSSRVSYRAFQLTFTFHLLDTVVGKDEHARVRLDAKDIDSIGTSAFEAMRDALENHNPDHHCEGLEISPAGFVGHQRGSMQMVSRHYWVGNGSEFGTGDTK